MLFAKTGRLPLPFPSWNGRPQAGNGINVMVETTYNADSLVLTLRAKNPTTGDQTTQYGYGATLPSSSIARNDLLVAQIYPDAADAADRVTFAYNRQGQPTSMQDQNGTVHCYKYDLLGRRTTDSVTLPAGSAVDMSVLQIAMTYEIHGLVEHVTSYSDTAGTMVVNDVIGQSKPATMGGMKSSHFEWSAVRRWYSVSSGSQNQPLWAE